MSFDFNLLNACPHSVFRDELELINGTECLLTYPPSSVNEVYVNGVLVPQGGLMLPARWDTDKTFPITIGSSSDLSLTVNGEAYTIRLALGSYDLNRLRQSLLPIPIHISAPNNKLCIRSRELGATASIGFGSSAVHGEMGLPNDRMVTGSLWCPPWGVVDDDSRLFDEYRKIVFSQDLRNLFGLGVKIECSYVTPARSCRRCFGLRLENDWRYNENGEIITIEEEALLLQEVRNVVLTMKGTNRFHSWYGTQVMSIIGDKYHASLDLRLMSEISQVLQKLQSIKKQQERVQYVSDGEYLFRVDGVSVKLDANDPTIIRIAIGLKSRRNTPVTFKTSLVRSMLELPLLNGTDGAVRIG